MTDDAPPRPGSHVAELNPPGRAAPDAAPAPAAAGATAAAASADVLADGAVGDGDAHADHDADVEADADGEPPHSHSLYSRRMRLSILSILTVPILFAIAPIELSMPFAVVALAAPLLTTCDCRRDSHKEQRNTHSAAAAEDTDELHKHTDTHTHTHSLPDRDEAATAETAEANEGRADTAKRGYTGTQMRMHTQHSSAEGAAVHLGQTAARLAAGTQLSSSHSHSHAHAHAHAHSRGQYGDHAATTAITASSDEVSIVRSEERLVVRKERLVTHKLVVRKVVSTEMVVMSVPVRRERLEVETVQLDTPILLPDDADEQTALVSSAGYVTALPPHGHAHAQPGDRGEVGGKSFSGDRHNYAGVDAAGRSMIELLLCEERPRVSMEVVAVKRVSFTRAAYHSSQLLEADLRKEHIDYVAPHTTQASFVQQQGQQQQKQREW